MDCVFLFHNLQEHFDLFQFWKQILVVLIPVLFVFFLFARSIDHSFLNSIINQIYVIVNKIFQRRKKYIDKYFYAVYNNVIEMKEGGYTDDKNDKEAARDNERAYRTGRTVQ